MHAHTVQALGRSYTFEQDLCLGDMRLRGGQAYLFKFLKMHKIFIISANISVIIQISKGLYKIGFLRKI